MRPEELQKVAGDLKPTILHTENFIKAKNLKMEKYSEIEEKMVSYIQEEDGKVLNFQGIKA
jgi:hypothetical protein